MRCTWGFEKVCRSLFILNVKIFVSVFSNNIASMEVMNFNTAMLKNLMVHYVGNKNNGDPLTISADNSELDPEATQHLADGLLYRFKSIAELYAFHHTSSLQYNEVYSFCKAFFNGNEIFEKTAALLARHLYEASTHPKVKGGEFYVTCFEGVPVESRLYKAIGFFKTETKALFLDVATKENTLTLQMKEGVELTKIDKGCLILNRNEEAGYDVRIFDNQNRGAEAVYWKETFLGLTPQKNEFHHTAHLLTLTKQFITGPLEETTEKKEQVELLQKSIRYFQEKEQFDIDDFQTDVFGDDEKINAFRAFGSRYVESNNYDIASSFDISHEAVKKQAKIYKSVLKLDKNFHIYIHGRTDLIERGTEADGRKYYKIYFQEEA